MMKEGKGLHMITFLLLVIGGLNWLLMGIFQWEVGMLFGGMSAVISRIIYVLVGLSAVVEIATHKKNCRACGQSGMSGMAGGGMSSGGGSGMGG
jgi:hypothetical protein